MRSGCLTMLVCLTMFRAATRSLTDLQEFLPYGPGNSNDCNRWAISSFLCLDYYTLLPADPSPNRRMCLHARMPLDELHDDKLSSISRT